MAQNYDEEDDQFVGPDADAEELRFLRFFYRTASNAMGPADSDIYDMIKEDFTERTGVAVPPAYYPPIGA